jgi:Asp-tRNA(Asn)/Glu-tRNA(Gln) amidotransferase B subunit
MEKGQMRVEVNISVSKTEKFGTKVEIKNLNSFGRFLKCCMIIIIYKMFALNFNIFNLKL